MGVLQASWRLLFLWFLIIDFKVKFDVRISSSVHLAEQSCEFLNFRDWLLPAGTSLSITEMKLLYDDGCLAAKFPDPRGTILIGAHSRVPL